MLPAWGDSVVLWGGRDCVASVKLEEGGILQTRCGVFHHADIAGIEWGSRIRDRKVPAKAMVLLKPTSENITLTLIHRTQILYTPDIALITLLLDARPGHCIVESGTGSGSLSASLARCVRPHGQVLTFECDSERYTANLDFFTTNGLSDVVKPEQRDVYESGFGLKAEFVDSVFLDLPSPWLAIPHAHQVLKTGRPLVIFSPCFEQVQQSAAVLRELRYFAIECKEVMLQNFGIWTSADVARRRALAESSKKSNPVHMEAVERKKAIGEEMAARLALPDPNKGKYVQDSTQDSLAITGMAPLNNSLYPLPVRGHTGYILVGFKPSS